MGGLRRRLSMQDRGKNAGSAEGLSLSACGEKSRPLSFCSTYNTKSTILPAGPHPKARRGYGGVLPPRGIIRQLVWGTAKGG